MFCEPFFAMTRRETAEPQYALKIAILVGFNATISIQYSGVYIKSNFVDINIVSLYDLRV